MNNRQKRLCRALLDFYDTSGAQPYPLAQLARKTGYDASDIYDKDSQSGDLWPFDPKARGSYAGMLSFTGGKNPTVGVTSAGLVSLENLLKDEPASAAPEKTGDATKPRSTSSTSVPAFTRSATTPPKPAPVSAKPFPAASKPPIPVPAKSATTSTKPATPSPRFTSADIADAWSRFRNWLESDPAGKAMLLQFEGSELIEASFAKFLGEFLQSKDS